MAKKCYYCGANATSKEHAPPRCLFPKQDDVGGIDFRKNLLTVPSCDEHNSETSRDDEFLLACLTPIVGNNLIGFVHTQTKLRRAMEHTDGNLQKVAVRNAEQHIGHDKDGNKYPVLIGKPDDARLDKCFDKIVRAIWYLENGRTPFNGKTRFLPGFLVYDGGKIVRDGDNVSVGSTLEYTKYVARVKLKQEFANIPIKGANPDIFRYQIGPPDQNQITPMLLTFYGNAEVMCALHPTGAPALRGTLDTTLAGSTIEVQLDGGRTVSIRLNPNE